MSEVFGFVFDPQSPSVPLQAEQYPIWVLAYYQFTPLSEPHALVQAHHNFFAQKPATGRIYISEEGINGQMSARRDVALDYMNWLSAHFPGISFKVHCHEEQIFPRMTVKYRQQLVALDQKTNMANRGSYLSPQEWRQTLESEEDYILLDVRNDYEWQLGHFKQSTLPPCSSFREFLEFADQLKQKVEPQEKKVLMCCTGGIRCEIFSAHLKEIGFEKVFQLEGGIIKYGLEEGGKHWLGKLFVFDDRLAIDVNAEEKSVIGKCHHCGQPNETYYNCANMDCNELFLCCSDCLESYSGCCSTDCRSQPRVRPLQKSPKPFKKWYHYAKKKEDFWVNKSKK